MKYAGYKLLGIQVFYAESASTGTYHGQWSHLPSDEIIRRMNHSLPPVHFPQHLADDLGNKCCAKMAFKDLRANVVPVGKEALWGINAMERDDEL